MVPALHLSLISFHWCFMGSRRKARECALQMLFAADFAEAVPEEVLKTYWAGAGRHRDVEETAREFATRLAAGTLVAP